MFNPSSDLIAIQNMLRADAKLLRLMNLEGKSEIEVIKKIITKSKWADLVTGERRLCFYFLPARKLYNQAFTQDVIEFDCHVPSDDEVYGYRILERVHELIYKKKVNNRYMYFEGQLGELATLQGFFCCASRYTFSRII